MDYRLIFEHLMCDAFSCARADFGFANANFYDAGIGKHPEIKIYITCALIALAYKKYDGERRAELLDMAKEMDNKMMFTDDDIGNKFNLSKIVYIMI